MYNPKVNTIWEDISICQPVLCPRCNSFSLIWLNAIIPNGHL
uniref:Uncharacterized protein n=1 Tax=Rhizophora mucronata TaxID=61149 RepID=A0A2P2QE15_RHIMU